MPLKSASALLTLAATAAALSGCSSRPDPEDAMATMRQYCADCHNDVDLTAELSFEGLSPENVAAHAEAYEKAVRKLRARVMPPPGEPQPESGDVDELVAWLETTLDANESIDRISDQVVLHRLNRREYQNAIRDLLAVEVDGAAVLPADEIAGGFDNIASALQVSPSFIEQYVIAAHSIAVEAVGRPDARAGGWTFDAGPGNQRSHVAGLPLGTRGGMVVEHNFPSDGEYVIDIADMVTHIWGNGMEFENPLVVTLDNAIVYEATIGGDDDARHYDQINDGAFDRVNVRLKGIRFTTTAGPHRVGVTFRRQSFAESDDRLQEFVPGGGQDRLYRVSSFQILGPYNPTGLSDTPSRKKIFVCHPDDGADPALCAEEIITALATRAYRRPIGEDDLGELLAYYHDGAGIGGFEEGIRSAVTGILASPWFLYRAEQVPPGLAPGETWALSDLELASKLSFFLWNSIPDDELLDLAISGTLDEPDVLNAQIDRLLADPRSETLASNFIYQWLDMRRLDEVVPDRDVFPYASGLGDPREDYLTELELFADSIFRENRSVAELLSADHTFLNERTALNYGITTVKGDRFQRVTLDDTARFGLLGKGAVLMAAAYPNRTSPVLRGAFILKHLQGSPPPTPPQQVPALDEADIGTVEAKTVRELMAQHRENPTCFSCHAIMDPLGFALENFDATGIWRDRDRYAGVVIDASGELPDGTPVDGPDDLREALLRRPDQFVQTFVEGLLTYATGETLDYRDMPTVRRIVREAADDDYRFATIVRAIVASDQFRMRKKGSDPISAGNGV
jgi:mono/diheme cytochrome c family protein